MRNKSVVSEAAEINLAVELVKLAVTVSVGVAAMATGIANWEALMSCSERAVHLAKQFGRNRCMLHPLNVGATKVRALSA